jgi:hypothetical protein
VGPALHHADVVVVILPLSPLADDERPKSGAPAVAWPSRRAPRLPVHPGHPRTPHRAALFKPPPSPSGAPNPSRPRGNSPDQPRRAAGGEGREGGKEEERSRPRGSRPSRRPKPPEVGAGPAGNDYIPCFLFFPAAPPPASSSSSPASRTTSPAPTPALRPVAAEVRTPHLPSCGRRGHRAEAERSAPPRRRAAAGDAGHRARLG